MTRTRFTIRTCALHVLLGGTVACVAATGSPPSSPKPVAVVPAFGTVFSAILTAVQTLYPNRSLFVDQGSFVSEFSRVGVGTDTAPDLRGFHGDIVPMSLRDATMRESEGGRTEYWIRDGRIHVQLDHVANFDGGIRAVVTIHDTETRPDGHRALSYERIRLRLIRDRDSWRMQSWEVEESS